MKRLTRSRHADSRLRCEAAALLIITIGACTWGPSDLVKVPIGSQIGPPAHQASSEADRSACRQGDRSACERAGDDQESRKRAAQLLALELVATDLPEAVKILGQTCEQYEDAQPCFDAAMLEATCTRCIRDEEARARDVRRLQTLACRRAHARACSELGRMFEHGSGGLVSAFDGARNYHRACLLGDPNGCRYLAALLDAKPHLAADFGPSSKYRELSRDAGPDSSTPN